MRRVRDWYVPDSERHLIKYLLKDNSYQKDARDHALSFVKSFGVAVDIGAHIGLWTRDLAEKFKFVYAFEPCKEHTECFHKNVVKENVTLFKTALGHTENEVSLIRGYLNTGHTFVWKDSDGLIDADPIEAKRVSNFKAYSLDSFKLPSVDFIKIDCEGYEPKILMGAKETIQKHRPIINVEQKNYLAPGEQHSACKFLETIGMRFLSQFKNEFVYGWY